MKKQELILELMNLYDEKEQLERDNRQLQNQLDKPIDNSEDTTLNRLERTLFDVGRKTLFESITRSFYKSVKVSRDEETEEVKAQTYKNWFNNIVVKDRVPVHLSTKEVLDYFEDDFKSLYEEQKKIALEDLKIEEQ